ncbi:MAG: glycosyltransferase family 9 protein [Nitrospinales bacterium]
MKFDLTALPPDPKILLVRLRSIGDVTLSTAVFPSIKETFPGCKLDFLVMPPNDELVRHDPHLDEIILLDRGWPALLGLLRKLRKTSYDLVVDLHGGPRSAWITVFSKAKCRVGLARSRRARFYNVTVDPVFKGSVPAVRFQARMLELLGFEVRRETPKIYVNEDERKSIEQKLMKVGVGSEYAVIHPGVDSPHNDWQAEKFARVADALQGGNGLRVVFACAPSQVRQVDAIAEKMQTPRHSLAGCTSLGELAALLQRAKFLLCHNSGPMHMAAAVGTPVFALFGAVAPDRWVPQVEPHHVFYKNVECSPCTRVTRKPECFRGDAECKRLISADEVVLAIRETMNLDQPPPSKTQPDGLRA